MRQSICIFGTGGLAKELVGYIEGEFPRRYEVVAAVSTGNWDNPRYLIPVLLDPPEWVRTMPCLLAIAAPDDRRKVVSEFPSFRWMTYVHPSAVLSPYAYVGVGSILAPQVVITGDARIGRFAFLNTNATVGHDSELGDYVTMGPNSEVCGHCQVGDSCYFGIGAYCLPNVNLPAGTKVSAGGIVRKSVSEPATLYGDPAVPRRAA